MAARPSVQKSIRAVPNESAVDDAVAVSGETAAGAYPVEAVKTMAAIAVQTEDNVDHSKMKFKAKKERLSISAAMAKGDGKQMRRQSALGLRLSFVVGLPCSIGMSMLSKQLLDLVYHFNTPEALQVTANLLSLSSLTIVLFTVVQSTSGILQGLKKQRIPMYTLLAGVIVKVFLNYTLIGTPKVNIYGAPIASLSCYTISMLPNLFYVQKYTGMKLDLWNIAGRPGLATAIMALILWGSMRLLPTHGIWTLIQVVIGMAAYVGAALMTGAVTREDIAPILHKFGRKAAPKKEDN